jgi:hypothetical protein
MSKEQYDSLIKCMAELEQQKAIVEKQLSDTKAEFVKFLCPFEIDEEIQLQRPFKGTTRAVVIDIVYSHSGLLRKKQGYSLRVVPLKKNGNRMHTIIDEFGVDWYVLGPLSWDEFARLHGKEPISFDD